MPKSRRGSGEFGPEEVLSYRCVIVQIYHVHQMDTLNVYSLHPLKYNVG
jgi:hypothetical protein